jgi:murein L,D-transpeptidase YcbB/YkuD
MKKLATFSAALTVAVPAIVALGGPAQAATSNCDSDYDYAVTSTYWTALPIHTLKSTGQGTTHCVLSTTTPNTQTLYRAVMDIQLALNACYGYNLSPDGSFGPQTAATLKAVQKRIGVSADGVYGPQTGAAMKWYSGNNQNSFVCKSGAPAF